MTQGIRSRIGRSRAIAVVALAVLTVGVAGAAGLGINAWGGAASAKPTHTQIHRMGPACIPPSVLDIDGLGDDATWNATTSDLTAVGQSLTIDPLDSVVNSVEVIVGDPSAVADPSAGDIGSPDVVARATASIDEGANNLLNLAADLQLTPPDQGNLPVFVLIQYTPSTECAGTSDGVGTVADPVGTLVVTSQG